MYLSNRDILRFMWKAQHKRYGFWLRGYTICACAPDSSIKAIVEAGSTSLFQNSMPTAHYISFPDLLFYIIHILFCVVWFSGKFILD